MQASPRVCGVFDQFKRGYGSLSRFLFPMADDRAAPSSSTAAAADSLVKLCFSVVGQSPPKPSGDSPMQKAPVAGPTSRKARAKRDVSGRRDAQSCNDVRPQRGAGSPGGGETKSQSLLDAAAVIDGGAPRSPARRGDRSSESGSEKEGNTLEAGAIRCVRWVWWRIEHRSHYILSRACVGCSRERNRIHARQSRLRRKRLMTSLQEEMDQLEAERARLREQVVQRHGLTHDRLPSQKALFRQAAALQETMRRKAEEIRLNDAAVNPKDRRRTPTSAVERLERMYVRCGSSGLTQQGNPRAYLTLACRSRERNRVNARKARQRRRVRLEELQGKVEVLRLQIADLKQWLALEPRSAAILALRDGEESLDAPPAEQKAAAAATTVPQDAAPASSPGTDGAQVAAQGPFAPVETRARPPFAATSMPLPGFPTSKFAGIAAGPATTAVPHAAPSHVDALGSPAGWNPLAATSAGMVGADAGPWGAFYGHSAPAPTYPWSEASRQTLLAVMQAELAARGGVVPHMRNPGLDAMLQRACMAGGFPQRSGPLNYGMPGAMSQPGAFGWGPASGTLAPTGDRNFHPVRACGKPPAHTAATAHRALVRQFVLHGRGVAPGAPNAAGMRGTAYPKRGREYYSSSDRPMKTQRVLPGQ